MRGIFLPGPFAEADLLRAILGEVGPDASPDALADHALRADPRGARVALVASPGAQTKGAVVRIQMQAAARLEFALGVLGGGACPIVAPTVCGRNVTALVASSDAAPHAAWPGAPEAEWRAHLVEVVREVMYHHGVRDVAQTVALLPGISYRSLARVRGRAEAAPSALVRGFAARGDVAPETLIRPYSRYFAVEEHRLRHRRFDGAMSGVIERAVFASGDAVTVLPYDPVRRKVLLIEQFRAGPYARCDPCPWQLEAVAGRCDAGEDAEATARREAREEAGLSIGRLARIAGYYPSPGAMAEYLTSYVGEADLEGAGGVHGLATEQEDIRVIVAPLSDALALVRAGEIKNAPTLVSLLWLAAEAERLAVEWSQPGTADG